MLSAFESATNKDLMPSLLNGLIYDQSLRNVIHAGSGNPHDCIHFNGKLLRHLASGTFKATPFGDLGVQSYAIWRIGHSKRAGMRFIYEQIMLRPLCLLQNKS